jgi:hypothetical protein
VTIASELLQDVMADESRAADEEDFHFFR